METKHTPQPWDLYRTPHGAYITIQSVNDHAIAYANTVPAVRTMDRKLIDECKFLGNVLALPQLVEALTHCHDYILYAQNGTMAGEEQRMEARAALRDAGLIDGAEQAQADHAAAVEALQHQHRTPRGMSAADYVQE